MWVSYLISAMINVQVHIVHDVTHINKSLATVCALPESLVKQDHSAHALGQVGAGCEQQLSVFLAVSFVVVDSNGGKTFSHCSWINMG